MYVYVCPCDDVGSDSILHRLHTSSHQPLTLAPGHLIGGVDIRVSLQQHPDDRLVAAVIESHHEGCVAVLLHTRGLKGTWGVRATRDTHTRVHTMPTALQGELRARVFNAEGGGVSACMGE